MNMKAYLTEARYECVRAARNPGFGIPFLVLPAALYLLFGVMLFGGSASQDPNVPIYLFMGFSTFGVMGPGMFGFGISVAVEREQGVLQLKRALPMPAPAYLIAKMAMATLFCAVVMVTMIFSALLVAHVNMGLWQLSAVGVVNTLGSLPFCAMGLLVGRSLPEKLPRRSSTCCSCP